jgi:hypothetical protein
MKVLEFPKDVDFLVGCGHPNLYKSLIDFSNKTGIPCFVEKPHLIVNQSVNDRAMIGYNFNFVPVPNDFHTLVCYTNGLYKSWPDLFNDKYSKYDHAFHSVVVQKYGRPLSVKVLDYSNIEPYNEDPDYIYVRICLEYPEGIKIVNYATNMDKSDIEIEDDEGVIFCKPHKAQSYYEMLKYYVNRILNLILTM